MSDRQAAEGRDREPLGRRIAKQRAALGWTQAELAERVAISRVALSHIEAGVSVANERTVALLAGVFGLEPHELVVATDYPNSKAERLPVIVARYTEVDLQLALAEADLGWAERAASPQEAERVRSHWAHQLAELAGRTYDRRSRRALDGALARLRSRPT